MASKSSEYRGLSAGRYIERAQKGIQGTCRGDDPYLLRLQHACRNALPHDRKSWLCTALGHQACMNGLKVEYYNVFRLFEEIALARIASTLHRFFVKLAQTDLLILDDFGMKVLDGQQLLDFMEIIED